MAELGREDLRMTKVLQFDWLTGQAPLFSNTENSRHFHFAFSLGTLYVDQVCFPFRTLTVVFLLEAFYFWYLIFALVRNYTGSNLLNSSYFAERNWINSVGQQQCDHRLYAVDPLPRLFCPYFHRKSESLNAVDTA